MPSLKDLKVRIKSVKSTQKITKAMKMVAAAKLRRAREAAEAARPYAQAMDAIVARLAASAADNPNAPKLLVGTGQQVNHLLIVTTADRGLCGAFNGSILRAARRQVRELQAQGKNVLLYTVGRKARDLLLAEFGSLMVGGVSEIARKTVAYETAETIGHEIMGLIESKQIDVVTLLFNHFKSVISQVVTFQQLMPLAFASDDAAQPSVSYEYEPSQDEILADLLPRNLSMQVFNALLETNAGFYGAQMNAMENATKNAGEMIKKLTLKYNRTRQANITKELIEIISGAEAL